MHFSTHRDAHPSPCFLFNTCPFEIPSGCQHTQSAPVMDVNEIARATQTEHQITWYEKLMSETGLQTIYNLASSFNNGRPCVRGYSDCGEWVRKGGYNMSFWVKFEDSTRWVVRFPMVGAIAPQLVDEKVKTEVATMMFLSEKTSIPVPHIIAYGLTGNQHHPNGLPFMIMNHMPGQPLSQVWSMLDMANRNKICERLSDVFLQLCSHPFDRVGALTLDSSNHWTLTNRPLTRALASLQRDGIELHLASTYESASEYFTSYFTHHMRRFIEQPNSTDDISDGREKYAALSLFQELMPRFLNKELDKGPFILCHGDLHQPNLLVDDSYEIVAVLDWEWSCVLPVQVALLPPPCLSPFKIHDLALGTGRKEFLETSTEFLDRLCDKVSPHLRTGTLSKLLKQMLSSGGYWFGQAIHDIYNFEYLFWDNLFPLTYEMTEAEAIRLVFENPHHQSAEEMIKKKIEENRDYVNELRVLKVLV